eukprot:CAMPEP_0173385678 /NCGR_PEP_ID=MMETSP1356-20130122/8286_1 /TAXON_ID=77927 ORGANISM="Hemiselmis virescens, Strain PCC157" /NCGR_SAMPLE_ID=MMETSP1356 /ASSEMBLY_ACC=CAM_ASM_000847 /LENGTH=69 /DNA_ID=CAMNT_0014341581 /DNA_START=268 /DNA_END=474 /DNA_ORIENTATION=-
MTFSLEPVRASRVVGCTLAAELEEKSAVEAAGARQQARISHPPVLPKMGRKGSAAHRATLRRARQPAWC